jgi:acetyl esterase
VVGDLESADPTCRKLATETGLPVVSVEYRLAPEHPPADLKDCYAALEWLVDGGAADLGAAPDRIVLAGDSAGGNLAAATALLSAFRNGPDVDYQVLIYPGTGDASETDASEENGEGYLLTTEESNWFRDHYFEREIDAANVFAALRLASAVCLPICRRRRSSRPASTRCATTGHSSRIGSRLRACPSATEATRE